MMIGFWPIFDERRAVFSSNFNQSFPLQQIMSDALSFTFSNPTPLCIGDPYLGSDVKRTKADDIDPDNIMMRTKNIMTSPQKRNYGGSDPVSTFSSMKFEHPRLFEGEEWVSKGQAAARDRLKAKKKQVSEVAFKPSSKHFPLHTHPAEGRTGLYDKIARKIPDKEEDDLPRQGFYTSPSKKGQGPDSLMGNNCFSTLGGDSEAAWKLQLAKNRANHIEKIGERRGFRSTVYTRNSGSSTNGFDTVYTRNPDLALPDTPDALRDVPAKERMEAIQQKEVLATMERRAFKPAKTGGGGESMGYQDADGNIRQHPPYIPEGERRPGYKKPDLPENLADRRAWKPQGGRPKKGPTSSVISKGIYKANISKFIRHR